MVPSHDCRVHAGHLQEYLSSLPHGASLKGCLSVLNTVAGFSREHDAKETKAKMAVFFMP